MWYLLVAAGAGYLAQRWQQNVHKARPLMSGCGENQRPSPPSSAPTTPKRRSSSFSSQDMPSDSDVLHDVKTGFDDLTDKEGRLLDSKATVSCVAPGSAEGKCDYKLDRKLPISSPQDSFSSPQVVKSNKRSACEAFLVPVTDAFKPIQGNIKDQNVDTSGPNWDFSTIDNKEQLQEESSSPSSCCSSNSTVINSPVGSQPILQTFGSTQFQGKEQKGESNVLEQLGTSWNNVSGSSFDSSPHFVGNDTSKGRGQGVGFTLSHYCHAKTNYPEALPPHTHPCGREEGLLNSVVVVPGSNINAATSSVFPNDSMVLDASTYKPHAFTEDTHVFTGNNQRGHTRTHVFTGDNQKGYTRTSIFGNDFMCTDKSMFEVKQGTLEKVTDVNVSRKENPLLSASHIVATERNCDTESESLVSFGLAMAVFFMVSSSKTEMEKMGTILKETEDLVSDMRKELEERKARSCVSSSSLGDVGNEELFAIETGDADVVQVYTTEKTDNDTDNFRADGLSDDESVRSFIADECIQDRLRLSDLEEGIHSEGYDSEDEKDPLAQEEAGENDYVVSMIELERKLWKIFQERQAEKISELEESLEVALSNLRAKEEELRWWKNRASWLMEHSFGSTSGRAGLGEMSIEDRVNIVGGANHTDELINSMIKCDAGEKITTHKSLSDQMSFLAVEGCIEVVENDGCCKNIPGHQNQMVRVGSACSISSDNSVLSFDIRGVSDSEYTGFTQPS
eukprot:c22767_g1_i1 orf=146-2350(+)